MWKSRIILYVTLFSILIPMQGITADFDGSKSIICAVIEAYGCTANENCQRGSAESINVPQFFRVDFKSKTITATRTDGSVQTTDIQRMEQVDGMLIFQGIQNGRAWSATISESSGKFVLTASGDLEAFVVFGACAGGCE